MEIYLDQSFYDNKQIQEVIIDGKTLYVEPKEDEELGSIFYVYYRKVRFVVLLNSHIVCEGDKVRFLKERDYEQYKKGKLKLC